MQETTLIPILLAAIVGFAIVAKRLELPYPIAFVIGGAGLAFFPNLPRFELSPDWVFLIFLPPLLYSGGWFTDWNLFRENLRPIGLLAIGLVIFTTVAVAVIAHSLVPKLGWPAAFALGAIISPPDAVAAGAVFERFSVPRRIVAILDGEGLVNDATALVIYRFAIAAVLTGAFSLGQASLAFVFVAVSGIALGLLFGRAFLWLLELMRRLDLSDYLLTNILTLLFPYAVYLSVDSIHLWGVGPSGVLATVAAGVYGSRKQSALADADTRLVAYAIWELWIFLLNGLVFLLIGLELREIVRDPSFALRELWVGVTISALVIGLRVVWVYPATYLPRLLSRRIREREGLPGWNYVFVVAWSGMRGIVSLAAALALPNHLPNGQPFPGRNEIIFITFCVIFATLVGQGLSLIPLLKWLKIDSGENLEEREIEVRVAALRAGLARLRQLETDFDSVEEWEVEGRLIGEYEYRIAHLLGHVNGVAGEGPSVALDHRLQQEALEAELIEVMRMRISGEIPDEIFRKVQYDLDLANARLS